MILKIIIAISASAILTGGIIGIIQLITKGEFALDRSRFIAICTMITIAVIVTVLVVSLTQLLILILV